MLVLFDKVIMTCVLVSLRGLEPLTFPMSTECSSQLSYRLVDEEIISKQADELAAGPGETGLVAKKKLRAALFLVVDHAPKVVAFLFLGGKGIKPETG